MKRLKLLLLPPLIVSFLIVLLASSGAVEAALAGWKIVPSSSPGSLGTLNGVSLLSTSDGWAVGNYLGKSGQGKTLTEHWDGTRFKAVSSPSVSQTPNNLFSVTTVSSGDVWAVGNTGSISGTQTLAEHWNGSNWQIVSTVNLGLYNYLFSVAAISSNDVWAVGRWDTTNEVVSTLIEHWNGSGWQVVTSPNVTGYNYLNAVAVVSASDIWAAGIYNTNRKDGTSIAQTLIEHWDGSSWQIVPSPNAKNISNTLSSLAVVSASDIWAVGNLYNPSKGKGHPLSLHWNGTQWQMVKTPNPSAGGSFYGVAAVSTNNVWAVGTDPVTKTLIENWNGTRWKVVSSPNAGDYNILNAVATLAPGFALAVGDDGTISGSGHTLAEVNQ
ncbi:MAG TPA: hypothetical protein VKV20_03095 [Ktedonobacteraceae bacterium]|jgi:hypothetical protein|nr:hypothetical protein [Ktedonobacteraceae bacterium]